MNINLYRNNEIIGELPVEESAVCLHKIMGEHSVKMKIAAAEPLALQVGDYLMVDGIPFTLYDEPDFTHTAGTYTYPLAFYAPYYQLNYIYHKHEATTRFDYCGGVGEHLALLLNSIHGIDSGFALGEVEENGTQLISFDKTYCLAALNKICETFKLEYRFDGKTLHVKQRVGVDRDYIFSYGRNNGLYSLERQAVTNRPVVTKLTGKGSDFNLPVDYRHDETPIPDTLVFGKRHLTMNTAKYGIREDEKAFEDIYPRLKNKKVLFVEVPADIEKATSWTLKLDVPFDLNAQLAPGKDALVHFTSGELQGESFTVVNKSFDPETKDLRIIVNDNDGYILPSASRQPHVGDSFVLLDIIMPADPYVTEAEAELEERTLEELKKICVRQFAHKLSLQERYIRKNNVRLQSGDKVTVKDPADGLDALIRITEVSYPLASPHKLSVLLSDEILYSYDEKIRNNINDITADVVDACRQIQNTSRRAWKDARELSDMIQGLEAELLLVGNPEGQFTTTCVFKTNKNNNPHNFVASAGTLQHKVYTDNPAKGIWSMASYTMTLEADVPYFLYARCSKVTSAALFVVSQTAKEVEDAEYYYFRVGLISSVFENARILKTTSGFTQIAGGNITAEKLQDAQQRLVIDLNNAVIEAREGAVIRGKIEFKSIDGNYKDVETTIDEKAAAAGTTAAQEKINGMQIGGVNLLEINRGIMNYSQYNSQWIIKNNGRILETTYATTNGMLALHNNFTYPAGLYTVSGYMKINSKSIKPDSFSSISTLASCLKNVIDGSTGKFESVIEAPNDGVLWIIHAYIPQLTTGDVISIEDFKIEEGNKATAWSPSLADQQTHIQEKIDGMQIGGVNLSDNFNKWRIYDPANTEIFNNGNTVLLNASTAMGSNNIRRIGECITSLDVETFGDTIIYIDPRGYVKKSSHDQFRFGDIFFKLPPNFKDRIVIYSETPTEINDNFYFALDGRSQTFKCQFSCPQFELGNKATAWSPSLADQQAQSEAIAQAKADLAETKANAHADGIVTAEEQRAIADAQAKYDAAIEQAERKALGQSWSSGKMLYTDPTFKNGLNGISAYNNSLNGNVTVNHIAKLPDSPVTASNYNIEIKNTGEASPGLGGFTFGTQSRVNAVLICRFIAKIPAGFYVDFNSNSIGDNPSMFWATPKDGTGRWQEYIYVVKCGSIGIFHDSMYFAIYGTPGTPSAPVTWHLAYASVFDVTEGSNAQTDAAEAKVQANSQAYLKEAFRNETTLQAGLVSTTLIKLGATNSSGSWIEKAGINGSVTGRGNNDIRFYAGGDLASAIRLVDNISGTKATFTVTEGGKLYAKNAEISGKIEATGGKIGNFEINSGLWFQSEGMGLSSRQLNFDYPDRSVIIGSHPRESVAGKPILGTFDLKNTTGEIYNEACAMFLKASVNKYTKALRVEGSVNLLNLPKGDTDQLYGNNNISSGDIVIDTGQNSRGFCMLRIKM